VLAEEEETYTLIKYKTATVIEVREEDGGAVTTTVTKIEGNTVTTATGEIVIRRQDPTLAAQANEKIASSFEIKSYDENGPSLSFIFVGRKSSENYSLVMTVKKKDVLVLAWVEWLDEGS